MKPPSVLFVCQHGAAKSVIGAALLQHLARQRGIDLQCLSAGVTPDAEIPPPVVAGLAAEGIDVSALTPQAFVPELAAGASHVVSFGCDLTETVDRGVTQWDGVPAVSDGYGIARDAIFQRVEELLTRLSQGDTGAP